MHTLCYHRIAAQMLLYAQTGDNVKAGMVAQIRVNPSDCQHVLDIMGVLGVDPYDGRSFAQCVSLAFTSLIGMACKAGIIPTEVDTFQYLNRMGPFIDSRNNKNKAAHASALYERQMAGVTPSLTMPTHSVPVPGQYVPAHLRSRGVPTPSHTGGSEATLMQDPALLQEYEELKKDLQEGEPDSDMLERFSYLQGVLFP